MRHDPPQETLAQHQGLSEARTAQEAALERFVVGETPARDFLVEQIQRAPWWAISLLIHAFALLIMWLWPYAPQIEEPVWRSVGVGIRRKRPEQRVQKKKEVVKPDQEPVPHTKLETPRAPKLPTKEKQPPQPGVPQPIATPINLEPPTYIDPPRILAIPGVGPPRGPGKKPYLRGQLEEATRWPPWKLDPLRRVVKLGLIWLAKAQERDGSWDAKRWGGSNPYSVGVTGLALLSYFGAGYTHKRGEFKTTIARALGWLRANQRPDGSFPWQTFYEQGIATMILAEAYTLTEDPRIGRVAQRAVDYICRLQPEHGGFRYTGAVARNEGDMSVTGWQIMAIKSAALAGLQVPEEAFERSRTFMANSWRGYGKSAYLAGSEGAGSLAISSVGMLCRIFLGAEDYEDEIGQCANLLLNSESRQGSPVAGGASKQLIRDLYYAYYSSLAMYQVGGEYWRRWLAMTRGPIVNSQIEDERDANRRFVRGSWEPGNHRWGKQGGRVYSTTMALLTLEVPYRYLRIYRQGP